MARYLAPTLFTAALVKAKNLNLSCRSSRKYTGLLTTGTDAHIVRGSIVSAKMSYCRRRMCIQMDVVSTYDADMVQREYSAYDWIINCDTANKCTQDAVND